MPSAASRAASALSGRRSSPQPMVVLTGAKPPRRAPAASAACGVDEPAAVRRVARARDEPPGLGIAHVADRVDRHQGAQAHAVALHTAQPSPPGRARHPAELADGGAGPRADVALGTGPGRAAAAARRPIARSGRARDRPARSKRSRPPRAAPRSCVRKPTPRASRYLHHAPDRLEAEGAAPGQDHRVDVGARWRGSRNSRPCTPAAQPRISTPPTAGASGRITVQPVRPTGSVAWPTRSPGIDERARRAGSPADVGEPRAAQRDLARHLEASRGERPRNGRARGRAASASGRGLRGSAPARRPATPKTTAISRAAGPSAGAPRRGTGPRPRGRRWRPRAPP